MLSKLKQAPHLGIAQQQVIITELLCTNPWVRPVLEAIKELPDAWVGAGIIFQNIWNVHHGYPVNAHIKDIDVFYWDADDLSWESEDQCIEQLNTRLNQRDGAIAVSIDAPIDAKNVARIHLWYEQRFGIKKQAYKSVAESIASWPVIGACLAMRLTPAGTIEFCAPYGFNDALNLQIRPNKVLVDQAIYEDKAHKWKQQWPLLNVMGW